MAESFVLVYFPKENSYFITDDRDGKYSKFKKKEEFRLSEEVGGKTKWFKCLILGRGYIMKPNN